MKGQNKFSFACISIDIWYNPKKLQLIKLHMRAFEWIYSINHYQDQISKHCLELVNFVEK